MKKIAVLIFILIGFSTTRAQEYKKIDEFSRIFIYNYKYYEEHKNPNSVKIHEMILEVGKECSKFYSSSKAFADSLLMQYANESPEVAFSKILPLVSGSPVPVYCNFYVFKNYPRTNATVFIASDMSSSVLYRVEEELDFKWVIEGDSNSKIFGLACKKATTNFAGRKFIAWFTLEIPINEGPYKFKDLPGLIVQISDIENEHVFTLQGIKRIYRKPLIYIENKYVNTSNKGYVKALEASKSDFIKELENGTFNDEATKIRAITRVQRRNNFIECF